MKRAQWLWMAPAFVLAGCIELPIPPGVDTGEEVDDTGPVDDLCAPQDPSGTVTGETQSADAYPTPEGGTIQDGVYDLVTFEIYPSATADDTQRQRRFVISGNEIVSIDTDPGAAPEILGGTFTTDGAELQFSISCPQAGQFALPYTATADELWLFDTSEPNVQIYKRQ